MSHVAWSWRGVICGEMVGIERQLDAITFISPRVVAQPGRPPDGCNGPHKNKSCYMLPWWWPASPIAFQRLSSPDASILKILYDVQWRELKGTTYLNFYFHQFFYSMKIFLLDMIFEEETIEAILKWRQVFFEDFGPPFPLDFYSIEFRNFIK